MMTRVFASLIFLLAAASLPAGETFPILVGEEGDARKDAFLELDIPKTNATAARLTREGTPDIVGQVHTHADRSRLLFVVPELTGPTTYDVELIEESDAPTFEWVEREGEHDLLFDGKPVLRYICPTFDKSKIEATKKPFHHVFDPNGSQLITKGAGGLYPHHRGIFLGYSRCKVGSKMLDTWHAKTGEHEAHREVVDAWAGPVAGGHTVRIDWNDRSGKPFLTELRTVEAVRLGEDRTLVEVSSQLSTAGEAVDLGGDRQHAGIQFRAAQAVADNQKATRFLRPSGWEQLDPAKEENGPKFVALDWDAMEFQLGDRRYMVAYLGHPEKPEGAGKAEWSERLYGRFGEFVPIRVPAESTVSLACQIVVAGADANEAAPLTREGIAQLHRNFASPAKAKILSNEGNK